MDAHVEQRDVITQVDHGDGTRTVVIALPGDRRSPSGIATVLAMTTICLAFAACTLMVLTRGQWTGSAQRSSAPASLSSDARQQQFAGGAPGGAPSSGTGGFGGGSMPQAQAGFELGGGSAAPAGARASSPQGGAVPPATGGSAPMLRAGGGSMPSAPQGGGFAQRSVAMPQRAGSGQGTQAQPAAANGRPAIAMPAMGAPQAGAQGQPQPQPGGVQGQQPQPGGAQSQGQPGPRPQAGGQPVGAAATPAAAAAPAPATAPAAGAATGLTGAFVVVPNAQGGWTVVTVDQRRLVNPDNATAAQEQGAVSGYMRVDGAWHPVLIVAA